MGVQLPPLQEVMQPSFPAHSHIATPQLIVQVAPGAQITVHSTPSQVTRHVEVSRHS
jgi:hypothetical protein